MICPIDTNISGSIYLTFKPFLLVAGAQESTSFRLTMSLAALLFVCLLVAGGLC